MRLDLEIDAMRHSIDSTDPEILGRWIVEIFARYPEVTPATLIRVQAFPSYVPDGWGKPMRRDWIADSRIIGGLMEIHSPRELVAALSAQLDEHEALCKS